MGGVGGMRGMLAWAACVAWWRVNLCSMLLLLLLLLLKYYPEENNVKC